MFSFLQRPIIDPCTTLPITGYVIVATVIYNNGSVRIYISNFINDTFSGTMGRFRVSYNDSFNETLQPNAKYIFTVNSMEVQVKPSSPPSGK